MDQARRAVPSQCGALGGLYPGGVGSSGALLTMRFDIDADVVALIEA